MREGENATISLLIPGNNQTRQFALLCKIAAYALRQDGVRVLSAALDVNVSAANGPQWLTVDDPDTIRALAGEETTRQVLAALKGQPVLL